ncbi:nucleoside deaminase [Cysteiniphilum sp. 6C5]|uniref:nucleoside deaminase n=1 Tax=unclassified Cysteiniphilum TaxID=2610889 RepID=UPI003F834B96
MNKTESHKKHMMLAYKMALKSYHEGGLPIGSVLVINGEVVGQGHNQRVQKGSSILHGEMDCLENSGRLAATDYQNAILYTTLSPCSMCSGAILLYKIPMVVISERENFYGAEALLTQNGVKILCLEDKKCTALMTNFMDEKPELWSEDIGI